MFVIEAAFLDSGPGVYRQAILQLPTKLNGAVRRATILTGDRQATFIHCNFSHNNALSTDQGINNSVFVLQISILMCSCGQFLLR